jgi:hypothetical protein
MRASLLTIALSLMCACSADSLTDTNGPLIMTVPATSVGPGDTIRAVITNVSRRVFDYDVVIGCASHQGPFERLVGGDWVRPVDSDTLPCAELVMSDSLRPGTSQNYAWSAPSDTGTYRIAFGLGPVALISHPIVVR